MKGWERWQSSEVRRCKSGEARRWEISDFFKGREAG